MLMRWLGGAAALSVLGLCVSARAADDSTAASTDSHWWDKVVPVAFRKTEAPAVATTAKPKFGARPAPAETTVKPVPAAVPHEGSDAALFRRLAVCDRVKQVAIDTENAELGRQVELLEQRVYQVYNQRKATTPARFESDEVLLDQTLKTKGRGTFAPSAGMRTANAREDRE
jgi:hypothetical protein